jgi:ABC-type transporter Mla maintaining outer membrane lipid asymmetry ATPase subunit MlaF
MSSTGTQIEVRGLEIGYGDFSVQHGLDFSIESGDIS